MESRTTKPLTDTQRQWLAYIQAAETAGQSLKSYADEKGLRLSSLYSWKAELVKRGHLTARQPAFSSVRLATPTASGELNIRLANGIVLSATSTVATTTLLTLAQGLNRLS